MYTKIRSNLLFAFYPNSERTLEKEKKTKVRREEQTTNKFTLLHGAMRVAECRYTSPPTAARHCARCVSEQGGGVAPQGGSLYVRKLRTETALAIATAISKMNQIERHTILVRGRSCRREGIVGSCKTLKASSLRPKFGRKPDQLTPSLSRRS